VEKDFHLEIRSRRRENKGSQVGFSQRKSQESVTSYGSFPYRFFSYMYMGFSGDNHVHTCRFVKESHVHLEKHAVLVRTTDILF
jgi:hypothetical protein